MDKVSFTANFTAEDYVRVLRQMQSEMFLKRYGFLIVGLVTFAFLLGLMLLAGRDAPDLRIWLVLAYALIPAVFLGALVFFLDRTLATFLLRRAIAKQVKSSQVLSDTYEMSIDETGISSKSEKGFQSLAWEAYVRGKETATDFLFYTSSKFSQMIPKSALSDEQIGFIRELARRKLGAKAEF